MCDETDLTQFAAQAAGAGLTRRGFAAAGAMAGLSACASLPGQPADSALTEAMVAISTPAGTMDAFFVHPAKPAPAVILWPDIAGLREAKKAMARRLAAAGYAVLVANPYYRDAKAPQFADFAAFVADNGFEKVAPWRARATAPAIAADARALVSWLDRQAAVDARRGIGNQGNCMGGPYTVHALAAVSDRIRAACSFHGGGLVSDKGDSPHKMLKANAHYLFAIAQNDDAKQPDAKTVLRTASAAAGARAEIEVYPADHGWCVPDSPAYDAVQADRAWARMLATYATAL